MRLIPRSLHGRMLMLSALAMALALAIAGWTIAGVLEHFVTEGLDRRLDAEISLLASTVDGDGRIDQPLLRQRLAALDGGPDWRWRIETPGGAIGSADLAPDDPGPQSPDGRPGPPGPPDDHLRPFDRHGSGGIRVHGRQLTLQTRGGPVVLTAAAPREVVERPVRGALLPLLGLLAALAGLLGAATVLQLRWGLRPLRALRDQLAAIRSGARARVDEDQPTELRPLAIELNQLAADNAAALATARLSAANLAHALKTPVATLALAVRGDPDRAAQVARIDATIRHHLARARAEAVNRRATTPVGVAVDGLIAVMRGLHAGRGLRLTAEIEPGIAVAVDAQDLDELIGNLFDNAARHAVGLVRVSAAAVPGDARRVQIEVADDGPGIAEADRARVGQPGLRLDERSSGHGFGLAIVGELATLYGGNMRLGDANEGGLRVTITLPAATTGN